MFTIRDHLQTPETYLESLQKISEIGYKSVQVSGPRPVDEGDIAEWCAEKGLIINSSHEASELILESPEQVVANLEAFGCKYTAYPFPKGIDFTSEASVANLIERLRNAGEVLSKAGKVLTYHNHADEFQTLNDELILERIYRETGPDVLQGEIDTFWVHAGGGDPVAWCEKLQNRLPLLHLKDFRVGPDNTPQFAEIGEGELDFPRILKAAKAAGCEWFIVEQDVCPGDPFDSLEMSFRYIRDNLVDEE